MENRLIGLILSVCMFISLGTPALALNSTCQPGNEATFETLEEARVSAPEVVKTYEGNDTVDRVTSLAKVFVSHPVLDGYPAGTTFVYRSPNMYGGRAAARMNTDLIVFADKKFADKTEAYSYLENAGLIDICNEAIGSIILVTPIGDVYGTADAAAYYKLQTAIFAQKATGLDDKGSPVYYSEAEYFGGFGYTYVIGVEGGASFFNNQISTVMDFAGRVAGALLIGGDIDEIRKPAVFVPVYLVNANDDVIAYYQAANNVNAVKSEGDIVEHYNQDRPINRVILANVESVDLKALAHAAYYDMFIEAMRIPVLLQGINSVGTPYSGYGMDSAPFYLSERNALINGVTADGIHLITNQGKDTFKAIATDTGEYLDSWYEYLPTEVLENTAPAGTIPLILGNHGGGDDPRHYVDEMGLLALAGRERIAVVAADHQNIGAVRGPALAALVQYMLDTYPALDATRVYAIGYSMGGGATYTVGYHSPTLFAGIAPVAGTNTDPTEEQLKNFEGGVELPIYLSTSSYDVRRLAEACGRINDALATQVQRWSAFNGVPEFTFDFETYPLSGFKGDAWSLETLNYEYKSENWYLYDEDGVPMVALNYVKDLIHCLYPEYANITWDYLKHFSRVNGEIVYDPSVR